MSRSHDLGRHSFHTGSEKDWHGVGGKGTEQHEQKDCDHNLKSRFLDEHRKSPTVISSITLMSCKCRATWGTFSPKARNQLCVNGIRQRGWRKEPSRKYARS